MAAANVHHLDAAKDAEEDELLRIQEVMDALQDKMDALRSGVRERLARLQRIRRLNEVLCEKGLEMIKRNPKTMDDLKKLEGQERQVAAAQIVDEVVDFMVSVFGAHIDQELGNSLRDATWVPMCFLLGRIFPLDKGFGSLTLRADASNSIASTSRDKPTSSTQNHSNEQAPR